jgi:hypothetical protein
MGVTISEKEFFIYIYIYIGTWHVLFLLLGSARNSVRYILQKAAHEDKICYLHISPLLCNIRKEIMNRDPSSNWNPHGPLVIIPSQAAKCIVPLKHPHR